MRWMARAEEADRSRRYVEVEEGAAWVRDYFGRAHALALTGGAAPTHAMACPQAFLVEQQPNQLSPPHFHLVDQFQVVVAGDGMMGKRPVSGIGVHYANAYTTYGPLAAGPDGVHYITMRPRWDTTLAHFMPKCRAELKPEPRRHLLIEAVAPATADELAALSRPRYQDLHEPDPDGLAVWRFRLPPGATADGPDPASGGGQYWLVLAGGLATEDGPLTPMSCLFLDSDEGALAMTAGPFGVEMLGLQFARRESQH